MTSAEQLAINIAANEALIKRKFLNETWINAENIKLNHTEIPKYAEGILVAVSRLPINLQEEIDFIKEIKSAIILKKHGAIITLIPRIKRPDGKGFLPGPDAIVNGLFFEFKTVTGKINKVGRRFAESRIQGNNVYIRIENERHTKEGAIRELTRLISDKNYKGGFKGYIIFTTGTGSQEETFIYNIKDFKK
ncbi:MAG: hypothetical protein FWD13_00140 [Treponema sp.]|nr:hypothetical protein [Treponema sp.]